MDIIEDRHGKHSTMITSQIPVKDWYDVIGEKTIADAVLAASYTTRCASNSSANQ